MKTPARLLPLIEEGVIDEVIRPLMSGKEAALFVVRCGDETRAAKVYKDAHHRSFKQAVTYREGRKVRSSRRARAMEKGSRYGKQQQEEAWQNAEVEALYRLANAGVRVPKPYGCHHGVLLMELIVDDEGCVAPRLGEVSMSAGQAREDHAIMMRELVRMLCAGVVHGDLSEFNVLLDAYGPVIIDLPQVVDPAANQSAKAMFERDVGNMNRYYGQFAPELLKSRHAAEIWALYEAGVLHPDSPLTGEYQEDLTAPDVDSVLQEIKAVLEEQRAREAGLKEV
jgi:RIO kinase 1